MDKKLNIHEKLSAISREADPVKKKGNNPHFRSDYPTLESVQEVLNPLFEKYNIDIKQPPVVVDGKQVLRTIFRDMDKQEDTEIAEMLIEQVDPQKVGGCITYYRRYSLISYFGLQAVDDDGNTASGINPTAKGQIKPSQSKSQHPTDQSNDYVAKNLGL